MLICAFFELAVINFDNRDNRMGKHVGLRVFEVIWSDSVVERYIFSQFG